MLKAVIPVKFSFLNLVYLKFLFLTTWGRLDFWFLDDPKNSHLKELKGAKERLTLQKVDLLDLECVKAVINGCDGVFHTASPVTDNPVSFSLFFS